MMLVPSGKAAKLLRAPAGPSAPKAAGDYAAAGRSLRSASKPEGGWWRALPVSGAVVLAGRHGAKRRSRAGAVAERCTGVGRLAKKSGATDARVLTETLISMSGESESLARFFSQDPALVTEFEAMQPLLMTKSDNLLKGKTPLSTLNELKQRGRIYGVEFNMKRVNGKSLTLATCNVDAGIVCGLAEDSVPKVAKQLAAKQVLERMSSNRQPAQELQAAAEPDSKAAAAAEVVRVLQEEGHLKEMALNTVQCVGSSWKASLYGELLGRRLIGSIPHSSTSRDAAVAAAGEAFLKQVRSVLRVPMSEPDAPAEWAEALSTARDRQEIALTPLGSLGMNDLVASLLGDDGEQEGLTAALEEALKRQEARMETIQEMTFNRDDGAQTSDVIARRCWKVRTPEEEDWRREEIKGKLPAEGVREELSKALERNQVAVVSGGTGSGKSTQLPQFILDDWEAWEVEHPEGAEDEEPLKLEVDSVVEVEYEEVWYPCTVLEVSDDASTITAKYHEGGDEEPEIDVKTRVRKSKPGWARQPPRIVVTQPRRIAAVSLAQRVAWERFGEPGGEIGHAVRGDTVMPESDTGTVEYCTVGTLLRRVVNDPELRRYNVVILDEVHERDLMTDFLIILMREVLDRRPDLRLVLMSATLDVQTFVKYLPGCHVLEVPTATRFPVEEIHLEDPWFEQFYQTEGLLQSERTAREAAGAETGGTGLHEFGVAGVTKSAESDSKDKAVQELVEQLEGDEEAQEEWNSYADSVLEGERDPAKHTAKALRNFLSRSDESGPGNEELRSSMLAEQIKQLCSFSDEVRQAWLEFKSSKEQPPDEWEVSELLEFFTAQDIRPWRADRASWEVTSSSLWWGSDTNDSSFVKLAEHVILQLVPEMLKTAPDDEIGTGSMLCFLPGWLEIRDLERALQESPDSNRLWVLKLHSTVSKDDQQQVFESAPEGMVKIILATNIAESSVTINDVRVVVDAGLHREMSYDPKRRISSLETVWICQSNAVQRKGRAGRVRSGRVFRLYSREQFESVPWRPAPEMQRCNLAQTCLQTIALRRDPREFLAKAPDPPSVTNVEAGMAELSSIQAVKDGVPPTLLPVGQVLCRMPLEPLLGRAMMLGTLFGIPQMTAALLAVSSGRAPFVAPPDKRKEAIAIRREYCGWSDTIAGLRALHEFERIYREHGQESAMKWAEYYHVHYYRMLSFSRIKFQLLQDVQRSGLLNAADVEGMDPEEWGWEAGEEGEEEEHEADGAIFEADDMISMQGRDWIRELHDSDREVADERLLIGILCSAYPMNVALRLEPQQKKHITRSSDKAIIDIRSVNRTSKEDTQELMQHIQPNSWWLYTDLRMYKGTTSMCDTTQLSDWHVGLFAGLHARENPELILDNWISVSGMSDGSDKLLRSLRQELRSGLVWLAIATSWDRVAQACVLRSKAFLRILGCAFTEKSPSEEDVALVRTWQLPEKEEGTTLKAEEDEDPEDMRERLFKKTVPELKAMLREMGAPVSGRKADLVERCADGLVYGVEGTEEGEEEAVDEMEMA